MPSPKQPKAPCYVCEDGSLLTVLCRECREALRDAYRAAARRISGEERYA